MIYQTQIEERIFSTIRPSLEALGFDVVRVRMHVGHKAKGKVASSGGVLQVMIERLDGVPITLEDCERVSQHLDVVLHVEAGLDGECELEVSSAGVDKLLTREKDFAASVGCVIKLVTKMPVGGRKRFHGVLKGFEDGMLLLELRDGLRGDGAVELRLDNVFEAQLDYFAGNTKIGEKKK